MDRSGDPSSGAAFELRVFDDLEALSRAAARALVEASRSAGGRTFSIVLTGGRTPRRLYELLAGPHRGELPWPSLAFFFGDERYVPRDDPESNYRLAAETLFRPAGVDPERVHAPRTDAPEPEAAAAAYEEDVRAFFGAPPYAFDWVLLGLGEDGHIASLFPGSPALAEAKRLVVAVRDAPKPPPVRLTMTLPLLNAARAVHVLAAGRGKAAALQAALEGPREPERCPAQALRPAGRLVYWADRDAASGLRSA